jgi:hypothetical protein
MSLKDIHCYFRKVSLEQHSNLVGINLVSSTIHWFILRNSYPPFQVFSSIWRDIHDKNTSPFLHTHSFISGVTVNLEGEIGTAHLRLSPFKTLGSKLHYRGTYSALPNRGGS